MSAAHSRRVSSGCLAVLSSSLGQVCCQMLQGGCACLPTVHVSQGTRLGCVVGNKATAVLRHIFHLCRIGYACLEEAFIEKRLGAGQDMSLSWCQVRIYGTALRSETLGTPPGPWPTAVPWRFARNFEFCSLEITLTSSLSFTWIRSM